MLDISWKKKLRGIQFSDLMKEVMRVEQISRATLKQKKSKERTLRRNKASRDKEQTLKELE